MMYYELLLLLGVCNVLSYAADDTSYRLPETVIPERYNIEIITHLNDEENFKFYGKVWIKTKCVIPTNNITLHSDNLTIDESQVTVKDLSDNNKTIPVAKITYVNKNNFLVVHLSNDLIEDHSYELYISYVGILNDDLNGFYKSSYIDQDTKEKRWLAITQFEATKARQAFPCFDEPAMKATFKISLGRLDNYTSISNMPIIESEAISNQEGWMWDRYEESVPMSTYLVAFAVSDFAYKTAPQSENNVTFRIWARKDFINQVSLAEEVGPKCLEYYENYFNIKYPLPKQDMVAVPDFSAGAMENWGLITYREAILLYEDNATSASQKNTIASVIAHELAHQWFGNLVTMKWWTDLWLNEGFATYMASLAIDHLYPQWDSLDEEIVGNLLAVFGLDALKTSHPVSVPVGDPNEITEIFDTISYKKGSFLLHMIGSFLGHETFRQGVTQYLNTHQYNNAQQDDLWRALTLQAQQDKILSSNLTVKEIMDTWTLQTGFPLLTVTRNYDKNTAEIRQERFLRDMKYDKAGSPECWWVPLTYTSKEELNFASTTPKVWLSCAEDELTIKNLPNNKQWLIFNINASALYKINYDEQNWKLLIETLNSKSYNTIAVLNRVQLIDDSADLAWIGALNYTIHFSIIDYLKEESSYLPWRAALANVEALNRLLKRTSSYGAFKVYLNNLLSPIYKRLGGLELQDHEDRLGELKHQLMIASWGCKFEVGDCVKNARKIFKEWQCTPDENPINKDLRDVIYCTAVRHGSEKEWNFLWEQYQKSKVATEKISILRSLACTNQIWLLNRYLEWSVDENSGIRSQDSSSVFQNVALNDVGYYVAKSFFYSRIKDIHKYFGSNADRISRYLGVLAKQMINEYDLDEFKNFTTSNSKYLAESKQGLKQALETIQVNIQWENKHYQDINALLAKYHQER